MFTYTFTVSYTYLHYLYNFMSHVSQQFYKVGRWELL